MLHATLSSALQMPETGNFHRNTSRADRKQSHDLDERDTDASDDARCSLRTTIVFVVTGRAAVEGG